MPGCCLVAVALFREWNACRCGGAANPHRRLLQAEDLSSTRNVFYFLPPGLADVVSPMWSHRRARLQAELERAWRAGYDPGGAAQFGHRVLGSQKWIGTTECCALLRYYGLRTHIVDFHSSGNHGDGHEAMVDWVWRYFHDPRSRRGSQGYSGAASSGATGRRVVADALTGPVEKTNRPPLYFQHQGHSRTVVSRPPVPRRCLHGWVALLRLVLPRERHDVVLWRQIGIEKRRKGDREEVSRAREFRPRTHDAPGTLTTLSPGDLWCSAQAFLLVLDPRYSGKEICRCLSSGGWERVSVLGRLMLAAVAPLLTRSCCSARFSSTAFLPFPNVLAPHTIALPFPNVLPPHTIALPPPGCLPVPR